MCRTEIHTRLPHREIHTHVNCPHMWIVVFVYFTAEQSYSIFTCIWFVRLKRLKIFIFEQCTFTPNFMWLSFHNEQDDVIVIFAHDFSWKFLYFKCKLISFGKSVSKWILHIIFKISLNSCHSMLIILCMETFYVNHFVMNFLHVLVHIFFRRNILFLFYSHKHYTKQVHAIEHQICRHLHFKIESNEKLFVFNKPFAITDATLFYSN